MCKVIQTSTCVQVPRFKRNIETVEPNKKKTITRALKMFTELQIGKFMFY